MLTFRQSVILLVSIITILAIIAVGTGISPLYWPLPKNSSKESKKSFLGFFLKFKYRDILDNSSVRLNTKIVNSLSLKTQMTTPSKLVPKQYDHLTTVKLITPWHKVTNIVPVNATFIS